MSSGDASANRSTSARRRSTIVVASSVAERGGEDVVRLERVRGRRQRGGSATTPSDASSDSDSDAGSTFTGSGSGAGRARPASPAAMSRGDDEVRIRRQVERLDLEVGRARVARRSGDQTQRGLAVLEPPHLERAGPVARDQPQVAGRRRRADREQRGQMREHAGGERLGLGRHAVVARHRR